MRKWVFDLDGTLVDTFQFYFDFMDRVLPRPLIHSEKKLAVAAFPYQMIVDFVGKEKADQIMKELSARAKEDANRAQFFQSVLDFLKSLKDSGAPVAILTNRDLTSAEHLLEASGLNDYIDVLVSGDCVAERKPSPLGLQKIHGEFGGHPNDYIMIGDHEHDMMAATRFGAKAVRASWHPHWVEEACNLAHHQFYSEKDFVKWAQSTAYLA